MSSVLIRNMTRDDVPKVAIIEKENFSQPWSEKAFYDEIENPFSVTLVADVNGEIAGFLNVRDVCGEIYINNIAVSENFRRQGLAKALLCKLEKRNFLFITLEVRKSNFGAICLYEKLGYKNVGQRKDFYEKPVEDAILMTKTKG